MAKKKGSKSKVPKKTCESCKKEKSLVFFFKVNSPLFPDGTINICRDCVREQVDINNLDEVITFLRQIDKPFIKKYWDEALKTNRHPLGEYIRKMNSLQQIKDMDFDDSQGVVSGKKNDITGKIIDDQVPDSIKTERGKRIRYNEDLIAKWGVGYKKHEYLKMEKFYQDMMDTHDINTPLLKGLLIQLAKLDVKRDNYLEQNQIANYEKANKAFEMIMKSAGFRPIDRKGLDEVTGMRSFSQIFEEVEKRGFRKPPPVTFNYDIVDKMITSLVNYYHRLVGKEILTEMPEEIQKELDEFFVDDLTPDDDMLYDDFDFDEDEEDEKDESKQNNGAE